MNREIAAASFDHADRESAERLWHIRRGLEVAFFLAFIALVFGFALHDTLHDVYLDASLGRAVAAGGIDALAEVAAAGDPSAPRTGWLWQLLAFAFMSAGGVAAVSVAAALLATAGFAVMLATAARRLNVVLAGLLLLAAAGLARPYFVPGGPAAGVFLFGLTSALLLSTLRGQSRRFWLAVPLVALWVNIDFTWPAGAALALAFAPAALLASVPRAREKAFAMLAALAATLLSPDLAGVWVVARRLPLSADAPQAWLTPVAAAASSGAGLLVLLIVLAFAAALFGRRAENIALAAGAAIAAAAGLSAGSFPVAALAAGSALAVSLPDALTKAVSCLAGPSRRFVSRWVLSVLVPETAPRDAQPAERSPHDHALPGAPAGPAAPWALLRAIYGLGAIMAGAGLVAMLALFATRVVGSREYPFGAGLVDREQPARAIAFARDQGLSGHAVVHPRWAGYFLWTSQPPSRTLHDPRFLAATPATAEALRDLFSRRLAGDPRVLVEFLQSWNMRFALVPQSWPNSLGVANYWSPVYWDDLAALFLPNIPDTADFRRAHNERLTFPAWFGIGLTPETLPGLLETLEHRAAADPDSAIAQYQLGMAHWHLGARNKAVIHLIGAWANDPAYGKPYHALGDAVRVSRDEDILSVLLAAVERDPDMTPVARRVRFLEGDARYLELAAFFYAQALRCDRDDAMAYARLGNILVEQGDPKGIMLFREALQADARVPQLERIKPGMVREIEEHIRTLSMPQRPLAQPPLPEPAPAI